MVVNVGNCSHGPALREPTLSDREEHQTEFGTSPNQRPAYSTIYLYVPPMANLFDEALFREGDEVLDYGEVAVPVVEIKGLSTAGLYSM